MDTRLPDQIAAVRRFTRFYTSRIGALQEGLFGGALTLTEGRVVFELSRRGQANATALGRELGLDPGYMSRLLRGLEGRELLIRTPSPTDGRQAILSLTEAGHAEADAMDGRAREQVAGMLERLAPGEREDLVQALQRAQQLLGAHEEPARAAIPVLRPPMIGDMGWVIHRHAVLYAREYGWNQEFEAMVAEIAARFIRDFDPGRECCWIAERAGGVVGSAFVVRDSERVARLRMVYVEPEARGVGIGGQLVRQCLRFAEQAGYARMTLWTNDILTAARAIYQRAGFQLIERNPYHGFGHDLIGETWERDLG